MQSEQGHLLSYSPCPEIGSTQQWWAFDTQSSQLRRMSEPGAIIPIDRVLVLCDFDVEVLQTRYGASDQVCSWATIAERRGQASKLCLSS
jgi:hypothetical protein